ncbi:distal tail protein Dit [Siminovitchia terrae]|uniref:distal tail protein Dit n=1 Tax=Siminovitchia terrae TaxID=1914933 RepID=UPI0028A84435|nr:distal tail protein Dit [Siminovitchia terrae]
MTFNGTRKPFVTVLEKKRPYWAPLNRNIHTTRSGHTRLLNTEKEVLIIPVTLFIDGNSKEDLLSKAEEVAGWLITKEEEKLTFDDQPNRHFMAALDGGVDADEIVSFSRCSIEFSCLYKMGAEHTLPITTSNQTFAITGQESTPWTSRTRFTVPQSSFNLETSRGGKVILNYDFIAGDVLEIDYDKRDVRLNGKDLAVSLAFETVWKELEPGPVQIKASHPTDLSYSERYY